MDDLPDPRIDVKIVATLTPQMLGILRTHGFDLPSYEQLMNGGWESVDIIAFKSKGPDHEGVW